MTHALCLAAKRVDVRIITPGIPDKKFIYNITRSFYHGLVKHGVRVYEWTPGFCHAKMSVADDCMATCEQLIWIIEVYITILKTAVLWQIVRQLWK